MGKVTAEKAEKIRQCVLDCSIRRLTSQETVECLNQRYGIKVEIITVKRYKSKLRESAQNWIAKLAKSKRADYIAQYKERIDEVHSMQSKLWNIVDSEKTHDRTKVEAIAKLLNCTEALVQLYDSIPLLNAIRDYDNDPFGHNDNGSGHNGNGNGGSCSRSCSDFPDEESRYRCDFHTNERERNHHNDDDESDRLPHHYR